MIFLLLPGIKGLKLLLVEAVMWQYINDVLNELHKVFSCCLKHLLMDLQKLLKNFLIFKEVFGILQKKRKRKLSLQTSDQSISF